jgi:hypothetical protein
MSSGPLSAAENLQKQLEHASSLLRHGVLTHFLDSLEIYPKIYPPPLKSDTHPDPRQGVIVKVVIILFFYGMWSYIANFVNLSQDAPIANVINAPQDLRW